MPSDLLSPCRAAAPSHGEDLGAVTTMEQEPAPLPPSVGEAWQEGAAVLDPGAYLPLATERIRQALASEAAGDYQGAFSGYRSGVDLLLQGLPGRCVGLMASHLCSLSLSLSASGAVRLQTFSPESCSTGRSPSKEHMPSCPVCDAN